MADPKGFLTNRDRELPARRPVPIRLMDWREVYEPTDEEMLKRQAGRCMDCGIPFCHNGCPLGNLIPQWNDLAWRGDWEEAIERLHATNNFPEFTGKLCPAPCETACVLGINQPPVTIKQVEVSTIEKAWENGWVTPLAPERLTGKTVAVIGSGWFLSSNKILPMLGTLGQVSKPAADLRIRQVGQTGSLRRIGNPPGRALIHFRGRSRPIGNHL